jgi:CBS domain containing-hemolysin-like protein
MVNAQLKITVETIEKISTSGYSHVVVYDGEKANVQWTIKTK